MELYRILSHILEHNTHLEHEINCWWLLLKSGPTLELDTEKPGRWKTWIVKNLDHEKREKQLDIEKLLEGYTV